MFAEATKDISATARSQFASQLEMLSAFNASAIDSTAKLFHLNMQLAHDIVNGSIAGLQRAFASENPASALMLSPIYAQSGVGEAMSYGQKLSAVLQDSRDQYQRFFNACMGETSRRTSSMLGMPAAEPAPARAPVVKLEKHVQKKTHAKSR